MTAVENITDGANGTKSETKALLHGLQRGCIYVLPRYGTTDIQAETHQRARIRAPRVAKSATIPRFSRPCCAGAGAHAGGYGGPGVLPAGLPDGFLGVPAASRKIASVLRPSVARVRKSGCISRFRDTAPAGRGLRAAAGPRHPFQLVFGGGSGALERQRWSNGVLHKTPFTTVNGAAFGNQPHVVIEPTKGAPLLNCNGAPWCYQ